jgi:hypothetical protein
MRRAWKTALLVLTTTILLALDVRGQAISDYLITTDIGSFVASKNPTSGEGPGVLAGANHFYLDHKDRTYRISYFNLATRVGPSVQITQHAASDSDKWLQHELDAEFRNYYGIPDNSYAVVPINGNTIYEFGSGGWDYRWLSGNKVIMIEYIDLDMTKPEPIEVVRAYLVKHPSTLPPMKLADLRSPEYKIKWIKDEMERRLWLCDKWFLQLQTGKSEVNQTLRTVVKYLEVFLNYRDKYYGIKPKDEMIALVGYLDARDGTSIKAKLADYKTWWTVNKTRSISVP